MTRVCTRCKRETDLMFCPSCHVLTHPPRGPESAPSSASGDSFEATIWQGPNRSRGIEVNSRDRDKFFGKGSEMVVLHIDGRRTIGRLGPGFWKKPAVIKKALSDDGRDQLTKFFEKHHLLPPPQSLKEKGIVDTLVFEVVTPKEEFKVTVVERKESMEFEND